MPLWFLICIRCLNAIEHRFLLVNGSPKKQGCTYTALSEIQSVLEQHDIEGTLFHIGTQPVRGCIACYRCEALKRCVFADDCCNELLAQMQHADGIIIGSPVYYAGPNGALCALLDRAFYSAAPSLARKPAAAIVSCRRGGASAGFDRLNKYFSINQMPIITSQYWNAVHGNTPEEVRRDREGLQIMRTLARNMVQALHRKDMAIETENEAQIRTNFINS